MKSFETKLTVRLYDIKVVEKLNEIFKRNQNKYQTKNQLLVELLECGIKDKLKELPQPPFPNAGAVAVPIPNDEDMTDEILKQIKEIIGDMHEYNKQHVEGLLAHLKMSERLTSAVYNVLLAIATDEPVTPTQVNTGYFDDVPPRFVEFLETLLAEILAADTDDDESDGDEGDSETPANLAS